MSEAATLTKKDFESDQDVRWCPGCGDYAILSAVQKAMPEIGVAREKIVFLSGIGCSSRFPYYMNTYGFHTIHGRAPTLATGLKLANPELMVWLVTGDGDGLSIGGNHMLHLLRRNLDLNVLLFNNEIYGLTKGQYSPTSRLGTVAKSTPFGSQDYPVNPLAFALGAGVTWYARTLDRDLKHMGSMFVAAPQHKGTSFVEILQNCIVYNDQVYGELYDPKTKADHLLYLEAGKPMVFGNNNDKGLVWDDGRLVAVPLDETTRDRIVVHDPGNTALAYALSQLKTPVPMGIIVDIQRPTYEDEVLGLEARRIASSKADLKALIYSGTTWQVS